MSTRAGSNPSAVHRVVVHTDWFNGAWYPPGPRLAGHTDVQPPCTETWISATSTHWRVARSATEFTGVGMCVPNNGQLSRWHQPVHPGCGQQVGPGCGRPAPRWWGQSAHPGRGQPAHPDSTTVETPRILSVRRFRRPRRHSQRRRLLQGASRRAAAPRLQPGARRGRGVGRHREVRPRPRSDLDRRRPV